MLVKLCQNLSNIDSLSQTLRDNTGQTLRQRHIVTLPVKFNVQKQRHLAIVFILSFFLLLTILKTIKQVTNFGRLLL